MTSIYVSQLVRVDISFDVAVLTIETFYSDDWSSYFARYMMYIKIRNVKIWCKIMHMKRNLCKRPGSHRGKYRNIDMHKHHWRGECHTHSRMYTYTHSIQLSRWFFDRHDTQQNAFISTGYSILRNQHAKATYTSAIHCNSVTEGYAFGMCSFWGKCRDHSMFWDQYVLQSHISRHADLYLGSDGDRMHMLIHCLGNNSICYSDQCQQSSSLAMSWALCRQTGNAKS